MRETIHILKKDISHLRLEIPVVLASFVLLVLMNTTARVGASDAPLTGDVAANLASFLLPVSWWLLLVRAIYAEPLTGDCEFWMTRPYHWKSLLGAKALLAMICINLPLLAAQAVILHRHGFPLWEHAPELLWNQVLVFIVVELPAAVAASLTTGIVQFLLVGVAMLAGIQFLVMRFGIFAAGLAGSSWRALEWVHSCYTLTVIAVAAPAILVWQYTHRRTAPARWLAIAAAALILVGAPLPWAAAFAIQTRFSSHPEYQSAVHADLDSRPSGHRVSPSIATVPFTCTSRWP